MVTGGHGVRMQYDYTHDMAGLPGAVSAASPRWLRLTRSGDTITGYDSADGTHWTKVGTARLAGLASTVQAGLFATSPGHSTVVSQSLGGGTSSGGAHPGHRRLRPRQPVRARWPGSRVDRRRCRRQGHRRRPQAAGMRGSARPAAGFTVTGSGDIAAVPVSGGASPPRRSRRLVGAFAGLIAVVVVAAMFITAEYRRGLIRITLAASPRRGRVLAAKAIVVGAVTFVAGLAARRRRGPAR